MNCDRSSPYTPYTPFIDYHPPHHLPHPEQLTIQDLFKYRPTFSDDCNIFQLSKSDLFVGPDGKLRVCHPRFKLKQGFIIFSYHTYNVGWSQDTKSMFSAIAIVGDGDAIQDLCEKTIKMLNTCKRGMLNFVNRDGVVCNYKGPVNVDALRIILKNTQYI